MAKERPQEPRQIPVRLSVPDDLAVGEYANFMNIQATEHEFVLTFAVIVPPKMEDEEATARAVARIIIPHHLGRRVGAAILNTVEAFKRSSDERAEKEGVPIGKGPQSLSS